MAAVGLIPALLGAQVLTSDDAAVGTVADLLVDAETGRPAWVLLDRPGHGEPGLVPAALLRTRCRAVALACAAALLATAPPAAHPPSPGQARRLCRHFGVSVWDVPVEAALTAVRGTVRAPVAAVAA
jgi:PRC-barrel domain